MKRARRILVAIALTVGAFFGIVLMKIGTMPTETSTALISSK